MSIRVVLFSLLLSTSLLADWPSAGFDSRHSFIADEAVSDGDFAELWSLPIVHPPQPAWPGPAKWDAYIHLRGLRNMRDYDHAPQVVVASGRVYITNGFDDSIVCVDANTGETLWHRTVDAPIRTTPTVYGDNVYFGTDLGRVYCLNRLSGATLWRHEVPGNERPILNNGRLISPHPCRSGVLIVADVDRVTAYFGYSLMPWNSSYLCAVDALTGEVDSAGHFERELSQETLEGPIACNGEQIIVCRGRVAPRVFDRSTGAPGRTFENGGGCFLSVCQDGSLWHGPGNKTGWISHSNLDHPKPLQVLRGWNRAVDLGDTLIVANDHRVASIPANSSATSWQVASSRIESLIVAGQHAVAGGDGEVLIIDLESGALQQRLKVPGRVFTLAISDGRIFVATDIGYIGCYSTDSKTKSQQDIAPAPARVRQTSERNDAQLQPEHKRPSDRGLIARWTFHHLMSGKPWHRGPLLPLVQDAIGRSDGEITGDIRLREAGGVQALEFDGETVSVNVPGNLKDLPLPKRQLSVEAWVVVDAPLQWGGFVGLIQDNGDYERGWLLGYRDDRFSFALAGVDGGNGLTYAAAGAPIELGSWAQVVGTYDGRQQRLYVNGEMVVEKLAESGDILYPDQGFFQLGAYRDENEFHPMAGQMHEVSVYDRVLTADQISDSFRWKHRQLPVRNSLPSGPSVRFTSPEEAIVQWQTSVPSSTALRYRFSELIGDAKVVGDRRLKTQHEVHLKGLPRNRVGHYTILTKSPDMNELQSPSFELDTHMNLELPRPTIKNDAKPKYEFAGELLKVAEIDRGLCLVLGAADGELCRALMLQSRLRVIVFDTDADRVDRLRSLWRQQRAYGVRLAIHHVDSFADLPCRGGIANLVVSENWDALDVARLPESYVANLLAPGCGKAFLKSHTSDPERDVTIGDRSFRVLAGRSVADSGQWTHQYGLPNNSAYGGESLGGATSTNSLDIKWIGLPGPRAQPDRSGRKPSPLAAAGRLYVQGQQRIIAIDTANGTILWNLEIPQFERFNIPRDCANWCCDNRFVYAAVGNQAWKIDGNSGKLVARWRVRDGDQQDWSYDWSYIAREGELLIGSAVRKGTAFTNFWGDASVGWYDSRSGSATDKVCSEALFAVAIENGDSRWHYDGGVIVNSTITIHDGHVYFVECRNEMVKSSDQRRVGMEQLWDDQYLVCLDSHCGDQIWSRPLVTADGDVVFSLAASEDRLVINASNAAGYDVYGYKTDDGTQTWHQRFGWPGGSSGDHGKAMSRPAIVNARVYVRPQVLDLHSGIPLGEMPSGGCGTYAATTYSLIFRKSNISMWDASSGKLSHWDRMRPGCWLSTIPACGMLLSPEAGGGCSCGSWVEASIGFAAPDLVGD